MTIKEFFESEVATIAIHCDTEEKAKRLLKAFDDNGYTWLDGDRFIDETCYEVYKTETCYSNDYGYCSKEWYEDEGYTILEFEDIEFDEPVNQSLLKAIDDASYTWPNGQRYVDTDLIQAKAEERLQQIQKDLHAFEILKKYFIFNIYKDTDSNGNVWARFISIQAKEHEGEWDCTATANIVDYKEEFDLLKEVFGND